MSGLNNKKYLDETGLVALWGRITDYGAPRWTAYKPTSVDADENNVYIEFKSAATEEQKAANKGIDTIIQINAATEEDAGLLSAKDKQRVNNIELLAEDLVTIKNVKVGQLSESGNNTNIRKLNIDNNKNINWDFVYNPSTDSLDIIDVNASGKVMTSVAVNDFIGDAILSGVLTDSDIVDKDGENNSGTFIKLTFVTTKNDGTTDLKDIYINVADLIDFYTSGAGISIDNGTINHDETCRESTITLKIATPTERGGFVAGWVDNTQGAVTRTDIDARTFAVGIGKDNKAMVTVPIGTITDAEPAFTNEVNLSPATGGETTVVTDFIVAENNDKTGHVIQPTGTTIKIGKETSVTTPWTTNQAATNGKSLNFGDTITVIKDIVAGGTNGHQLTKSNTTWTLPQLSKVSAYNTEAEAQTITADLSASSFSFTAMTDIIVNTTTGAIQPVTQTFTAKVDVLSIPITDITKLTYPDA
jgi:hypothetical protein